MLYRIVAVAALVAVQAAASRGLCYGWRHPAPWGWHWGWQHQPGPEAGGGDDVRAPGDPAAPPEAAAASSSSTAEAGSSADTAPGEVADVTASSSSSSAASAADGPAGASAASSSSASSSAAEAPDDVARPFHGHPWWHPARQDASCSAAEVFPGHLCGGCGYPWVPAWPFPWLGAGVVAW
ncbi:histone-lysine N-methyltransferase 2A-like [Bacillus rossius redtenbacheri]|uniref:histone-lysine N-methyltransferase 2A-like n=1 Tax=Bacillus rossius redtenbacheri TaxID=93214 RepID=UPI002FDCEAAD